MNLFELLITQPILNLLLTIYQVIGDFGVSIIIFAVVVKFALWPITRANLRQTKKIRELQPELAKIKKESAGNRNAELLRTMQLYRENEIKHFRTMLMSIVQVVIFITLFSALRIVVNRTEISKFAYSPVAEFSRVQELTSDAEFHPKLFGVIHLSEKAWPISSRSSIFLLFAALGSSLIQFYLINQVNSGQKTRKLKEIFAEAAEGKEADQAELNAIVSKNMSGMLPALMFFTMINFYGAITFYYFVSNLIQLVQQKVILNSKEKISVKSGRVSKAKEAKVVERVSKDGVKVRRIKAREGKK